MMSARLFACSRVGDRSGVTTSSPETMKYGGGVELASHSNNLEKARETCGKMADQRRFVDFLFKYCNTVVLVMRQLRFS